MSILRHIAGFFQFRARAATLAQKVDDGLLSEAERELAVSALLLAPVEQGTRPAPRMAAKPAAV